MDIVTVYGHRPRRRGLRVGVAVAAALSALVALASGGFARAETPTQVRVSLKDLDLSTPKGARTLLRRIEYAAELVCGDPYVPDLEDRDARARCRAVATQRAVREADAPLLTEIARAALESASPAGD